MVRDKPKFIGQHWGPLPFESEYSIFGRVCVLNRITIGSIQRCTYFPQERSLHRSLLHQFWKRLPDISIQSHQWRDGVPDISKTLCASAPSVSQPSITVDGIN
jgi:hypothetical protein